MPRFDEEDAREVISALEAFVVRLDEMMDFLGERRSLTRDEKEHLQHLLKLFKRDIKDAAARGTVKADASHRNAVENAFFTPTVQKVAANLSARVNTHPIKSNWFSNFYSVRIDLTHPLSQLRSLFRE